MSSKEKNILDEIADVVGDTTKHYEYKKEFQDPFVLAAFLEDKKNKWEKELIEKNSSLKLINKTKI